MMKLLLRVCLSMGLFGVMHAVSFAQDSGKAPDTVTSVVTPTSATGLTSVNAAQYLLQASSLLYEQKNFSAAKNILAVIDVATLSTELKRNYVLQQAALALTDKDTTKASLLLNDSILDNIPDDDVSQKISLHELRAKVFELKNQFFDSAKEYLLLLSIAPTTDQQPYVDALWDSLTKTDTTTLTDVLTKTSSSDLYNWAELILITKDASLDQQAQQTAISQWFTAHPNHPIPSLLKSTSQPSKS